MTQTPAGWHRDNIHPDQERYWDGAMWTEQTRPAQPAPPAGAAHSYPPAAAPSRPWFKKKRWIISGAAVALIGVVAAAGGGNEAEPTNEPSVAAASSEAGDNRAEPKASTPAVVAEPEPELTVAQENAVRAAESYLDFTGFSRKGLIRQLSSDAGDGYKKADATAAVESLTVDWKEQAVRSAKAYLEFTSFSRQGLIEQLSSDAGDGYTVAEAKHAANKVGLK